MPLSIGDRKVSMTEGNPTLLLRERPRARWHSGRRCRIYAENDRLVVRTRWVRRSWKLGPGGAVSAAYLGVSESGNDYREKSSLLNPLSIIRSAFRESHGVVEIRNEVGESMARFAPSQWQPYAGGPIPLKNAAEEESSPCRRAEYLRLSGIRDFFSYHNIPVEMRNKPSPKARRHSDMTIPGTPFAGSWLISGIVALTLIASVIVGLAGYETNGWDFIPLNQDEESWRVLVVSVLTAGFILLPLSYFIPWLLNFQPERPHATLHPSPGIPVTAVFRRRTSLRLVGEDLVLRNAANVKRRFRGPSDPVLGVKEAVILKHEQRRWGVAFVDDRNVVRTFLHWDTWFGGDPTLRGLHTFCSQAGLSIREESEEVPKDLIDATAMRWGILEYTGSLNFSFNIAQSLVPWLVCFAETYNAWGRRGDPIEYDTLLTLCYALGPGIYFLRACYRSLWLQRMVTVKTVSKGRFQSHEQDGKGVARA